ncbi:hypothetical protein [Bacillus sp. AK128]
MLLRKEIKTITENLFFFEFPSDTKREIRINKAELTIEIIIGLFIDLNEKKINLSKCLVNL